MLLKNPTGLKQWPTLTAQKSVCIIQCDSSSEWEDDTVEFFQPPPPPFPKIVFPEGSFHNRFQIFHTLKNQDSWAQLLIPSFSWRLYDKLEIVQHFLIQLLLQTSSMQTMKLVNSIRRSLHYYVALEIHPVIAFSLSPLTQCHNNHCYYYIPSKVWLTY